MKAPVFQSIVAGIRSAHAKRALAPLNSRCRTRSSWMRPHCLHITRKARNPGTPSSPGFSRFCLHADAYIAHVRRICGVDTRGPWPLEVERWSALGSPVLYTYARLQVSAASANTRNTRATVKVRLDDFFLERRPWTAFCGCLLSLKAAGVTFVVRAAYLSNRFFISTNCFACAQLVWRSLDLAHVGISFLQSREILPGSSSEAQRHSLFNGIFNTLRRTF